MVMLRDERAVEASLFGGVWSDFVHAKLPSGEQLGEQRRLSSVPTTRARRRCRRRPGSCPANPRGTCVDVVLSLGRPRATRRPVGEVERQAAHEVRGRRLRRGLHDERELLTGRAAHTRGEPSTRRRLTVDRHGRAVRRADVTLNRVVRTADHVVGHARVERGKQGRARGHGPRSSAADGCAVPRLLDAGGRPVRRPQDAVVAEVHAVDCERGATLDPRRSSRRTAAAGTGPGRR